MSAALALYRAATGLAEPLAPALLRGRMKRGKEDPERLAERLGHASRPRPQGLLVWLHGASVGEALSLLPLIGRLRCGRPDLNLLVTTGTTTSAELLARRLPDGVIHQYAPVDAPGAARRFLDAWRPDLAVFVESELWPNLLTQARARGVRLAAVSARMSEQSARDWRRMPGAARSLFAGFDLVLPQDDQAAARLAALGARDGGRLNLKLAGDPLPVDRAVLDAVRRAAGDRPLLLAASTHPGEEEIASKPSRGSRATGPNRRSARRRAPPSVRGAAIAARARLMGFSTWLRSEAGSPEAEVWVADTLGELGLWFRLATSALMGGSFAEDIGGHNPLEPARLDCPVVAGPHTQAGRRCTRRWTRRARSRASPARRRWTGPGAPTSSSPARRGSAPNARAGRGGGRPGARPRRRAPAGAGRVKLPTPRWWYRRKPPAPDARPAHAAVLDLGGGDGAADRADAARRSGRAGDLVGNLTVGGSGKTPVVREVLARLRAPGYAAHVLSRGYGGRLGGVPGARCGSIPHAIRPTRSATSR